MLFDSIYYNGRNIININLTLCIIILWRWISFMVFSIEFVLYLYNYSCNIDNGVYSIIYGLKLDYTIYFTFSTLHYFQYIF